MMTNRMDSITPIKMRIKTGVLLTKSFQSDFFNGELNAIAGIFIIFIDRVQTKSYFHMPMVSSEQL